MINVLFALGGSMVAFSIINLTKILLNRETIKQDENFYKIYREVQGEIIVLKFNKNRKIFTEMGVYEKDSEKKTLLAKNSWEWGKDWIRFYDKLNSNARKILDFYIKKQNSDLKGFIHDLDVKCVK